MKSLFEILIKKIKFRNIFKNEKTRSKTLYDVLRPINILSTFFGLRVLEIPRNHTRPILSFFYSMSWFVLNVSIWQYRKNYIKYSNYFEKTIYNILIGIDFINLLVLSIKGLHQNESLKLCVKKMHEIDKTLEALGSPSSFNKIYKKTIIDIILFTLFIVILATIHTFEVKSVQPMDSLSLEFYLSNIQYYSIFIIEFLSIFDFCTMVRSVHSEFKRSNDLLSDVNILPISSIASELIQKFFTIDSNKLFNYSSSLNSMHSRSQVESYKLNRSKKLLRTIRQIHLQLCRISKQFGNMYGIQMSLQIATCISCNTNVVYIIYKQYSSRSDEIINMNIQLISAILVCVHYSIKLFAVNYICERSTEEAKRTNEIIHTFYGKSTDIAIQKEVEIFSMQLMQCHTSYSAYGLFNFGCKHICSCIGVMATYVVIMAQVSDSME